VIRLLGDLAVGQVNVGGTLDASAPNGGDGGAIETSAATVKVADSARISTLAAGGKTGTWLVDPTDFTIAASGGDITGTALSNQLQSSNVTLSSTNGTASGNGDLFVSDAVSWSSNTTLGLSAVRDIRINSPISASGSGSAAGLTLSAGRNIQIGNTISLSGDTTALKMTYSRGGNYFLNNSAKINLPGNAPSLSINGTGYTVINSVGVDSDSSTTTLQGIKNNLGGNYVLGTDIDASSTSGWSTLSGFRPLGNDSFSSRFSGQFHGLGHAIANLTIAPNQAYTGLFGSNAGVIRDVGIQGETASGSGYNYVGGLVGENLGTISNSYVISSSSTTTTVTGSFKVGVLVGHNLGSISGSHAAGVASITAPPAVDQQAYVGGLVGDNEGQINRSYASGTVTAAVAGVTSGGLPSGFAGGLAGRNQATGSANTGVITNSYFSDGTVSGAQSATVGGLVGQNVQLISNSYAHATVSGDGGHIGGLVGENLYDIDHSYSSSVVSGAGSYGFAGIAYNPGHQSIITSSYWVIANGTTDVSGATGLTSAQALLASSYSGLDFSSTWRIYNGHTTPLLKAFLTPLVVTADNISTTYNGSAYSGGLSNATYSVAGAGTSGHLLGSYSNARNAGTYGADLWSDQLGYDISVANANLTINKAALTITSGDVVKTYDGTTSAAGTPIATSGTQLFGTDSLSGGTFAFTDKNAGTGKTVAVSGVTVNDGNSGNNYAVSYANNTASTINQAALVLAATSATKTYDGTTTSTGAVNTTGAVAGDTVTATEAYTSKNVQGANGSTLQVNSGYTITDASGADMSGNYTVSTTTAAGTINPAALTVTANDVGKQYDAVAFVGGHGVTYSGFVNNESASVMSGRLSYRGTAQRASHVGVYTITPAGLTSSNYTITFVNGALTITPAPLTITASDASKVFDGTAYSGGNGVTYSGFVAGQTAAVLGGALTYSGTSQGAKDVGSYSIIPGGLTSGNYAITFVNGTLTILPATLAAIGDAALGRSEDVSLLTTGTSTTGSSLALAP
jgi:hypothetical protein